MLVIEAAKRMGGQIRPTLFSPWRLGDQLCETGQSGLETGRWPSLCAFGSHHPSLSLPALPWAEEEGTLPNPTPAQQAEDTGKNSESLQV